MGLLSDRQIRDRCENFHYYDLAGPMIENAAMTNVREVHHNFHPRGPIALIRALSFGVSSYGYDARLAEDVRLFNPNRCTEIDPKNFDAGVLDQAQVHEDANGHFVRIPPNSFALGHTLEYFRIPRDCLGLVWGKSTYARCAIGVPATPLEPEWHGHVTLEFANHSSVPIRLYVGEGCCQIVFAHAGDIQTTVDTLRGCETSYADKNGKYQGQDGLTLPRA